MPFSELAIAIGSSLAGILGSKSVETGATPFLSKAKNRLEQKLKLGKYEDLQKAAEEALDDVVQDFKGRDRSYARQAIGIMLTLPTTNFINEMARQINFSLFFSTSDQQQNENSDQLIELFYHSSDKLAKDEQRKRILNLCIYRFIDAFKERLLQKQDFAFLREYAQLDEVRKQTKIQEQILQHLENIYASTFIAKKKSEKIKQEYYDYLKRGLKDHTIRGFAPHVGGRNIISVPLSEIFVPLKATEGRPALSEYAEEELLQQAESEYGSERNGGMDREEYWQSLENRVAELKTRQDSEKNVKLAEVLASPRSIILGHPGTGKTTITQYVAYSIANNDSTHIGKSVINRIPILIRVANYAKAFEISRSMHLIDYIREELIPNQSCGKYLHSEVEKNNCFIILDGLDEVSDPGLRIHVTERIQSMVASYSDNYYLVTSRIIGYDQSPLTEDFQHLTLQELEDEDKKQFIKLWYNAIQKEIGEDAATQGADDLINSLNRKPQIRRMAANPLLLTIMVLMHWRGTKLPNRRVQVYQNATDTLIEYWTAQREVEMDAEEVKSILAPIAHQIISSSVSGVIARKELIPLFNLGIAKERGCSESEAKAIGRSMLKNLNLESGLFLVQKVQETKFQLENYIHRSIWHEPLRLALGHLSLYSKPQANKLILDILQFPSLYEDDLQRNLIFAANCLADDIQVDIGSRDQILKKLARLLTHEASQITDVTHTIYESLEATRHRESAFNAITKNYKIDDGNQVIQFPNWQLFNLCKAFVLLKENSLAEPIAQYLEENEYGDGIRRLRFQYWTDAAADYLIALFDDDKYEFKINAGKDLASSILGPIDCDLARRTLSESGFIELLDKLSNHSKNEYEKDTFSWLSVLAKEKCEFSAIHEVMQKAKTPRIQFLAAKRLLNSKYRDKAIELILEYGTSNPLNTSEVSQALIEEDAKNSVDVNLLRDVSIFSMFGKSADSIISLFKLGDNDFAKIAAANYFAERGRQWSLVEALFENNCEKLGKAAAHWLSLYPGYIDRLKACEILLEKGENEKAAFALEVLATECHHKDAHQALEKLIRLNEIERIKPLLFSMVKSTSAYERYEAATLLAKANIPLPEKTKAIFEQLELKLTIQQDRQKVFIQAQSELYHAILKEIAAIKTDDVEVSEAKKIVFYNLAQSIKLYDHNINVPQIVLDDFLKSPSMRIKFFSAEPLMELGDLNQVVSLAFDILSESKIDLDTQYILIALSMLGGIFYISEEKKVAILKKLKKLDFNSFNIPGSIIRVVFQSIPLSTEIYLKDKDREIRVAAAHAFRFNSDSKSIKKLIKLLEDKDDLVRANAIVSLTLLQGHAARNHVLEMLYDESYRVRRSASYALWLICSSNDVLPLRALLTDEDHIVRANAVYILGEIGDSEIIEDITESLKDKHKRVRKAAAFELGELGDKSCIEVLLATLNDRDLDVKVLTAIALGKIGDQRTATVLKSLVLERNMNVRRAALRALKEINCIIDQQMLIDALQSQNPHHQYASIDSLTQLSGEISFDVLKSKMNNHISWVREWAIWSLGFLGRMKAAPYIKEALKDSRSNVRRAATESLGRLNAKDAIPDLANMLCDQDYTVRRMAAWSLGQIGDEKAIEPLVAALKDNAADVRQYCANALGEFDIKRLYKSLIPLLDDPLSKVRQAAAVAIGKVGAPESVKYLKLNNQSERLLALSYFQEPDTEHLLQLHSWSGNETDAKNAIFQMVKFNSKRTLEEIDKIKLKFPKREWLYRAKGYAFQKLKDNEQAESSFLYALRLAPESLTNHLSLAGLYFEASDFDKSLNLAQKACIISPFSAISSLISAAVLWRKDQDVDAFEQYKKAKLLDRHIDKEKSLRFEYFVGDKFIAALNELREVSINPSGTPL